jgi:hypothetical protein
MVVTTKEGILNSIDANNKHSQKAYVPMDGTKEEGISIHANDPHKQQRQIHQWLCDQRMDIKQWQ